MKNQIKLFIISFIVVLATVIISYINYTQAQYLQQELINKILNDTEEKVKFNIEKTDDIIDMLFDFKANKLKTIHKKAIKIINENPNIDINTLKDKLYKDVIRKDRKIHLYLINSESIIYNTTYKKDLGLDMKLFKGASKDIETSYKEYPNIIIAPPSIDVLTGQYRIYSYGVVNKEKKIVLEIGYFDNFLGKLKKEMYHYISKNSLIDSIELFGDYETYIINLTENRKDINTTKQSYLKQLSSEINSDENKIIRYVSKNRSRYETFEKTDSKVYKVIYSSIKNINIEKNIYRGYVVKLKFNTDKYQNNIENNKFIFLFSLVLLIFILLLYFNYLRKSIIKPMGKTIDKQYQELQKLNKELEQKVKYQVDEIKNSIQKFETIFDTVKDGIAIMDQHSNFLVVNKAYSKITGLTKEELYKTSCIELTDSDYIEASKKAIEEVNQKGYCYNFEKVCNFGERKLDVVMDIVKMPNSNDILIVTKDITYFKAQEKKIQEQSRLAQMGEMISMIAHQWRQPLGAISSANISIQNKILLGKFDLSKESDREKLNLFLERKTNNIEEYVEFLSTTIDEFRNFYKKDKDKTLITTSEIINNVFKIIKASLRNNNIILKTEFKDEKSFFVYKNELMQVILNILKNSEDNFLDKKQDLKEINIITKYEENKHIIIISDNGGGINNDILPHIFKPYFSTKQEKNGTGLGLYMSRVIVQEHHHGFLDVQNKDNGVTFTIELKEKNYE